MMRIVVPTTLGIALVALGWGVWLQGALAAARAEVAAVTRSLAVADAQLEQTRRAARIAQGYRTQMEGEAARRSALIALVLEQEGADAPLSDFMRAGLGRLFAAD